MRFTLREGSGPAAEADRVLLKALGMPSGGVVSVGDTHVQIRPAEVSGTELLIGPEALANSRCELGASVDVTRALPAAAAIVTVETMPVAADALVTALHGRVLTVRDTVAFTDTDGTDHSITVAAIDPERLGVVSAGTRFTTDHPADQPSTTTDADAPEQSSTARALLAGLDTEIDVMTGWFSLLAGERRLEASWGMPAAAGLLLEGPVGCGKRELVAEAARRAETPVRTVDTSLIFKPDKLLELLAAAVDDSTDPLVIFVDRLEAVVGTGTISSFRTQALAIIRWFLDAVAEKPQVACVIGVERVAAIDDSVRASQLLPRVVTIPPPDLTRRELLLDAALADVPHGELDLPRLASLSSGFSGADILAAVLHAAAGIAANDGELDTEAVAAAISDTPPSLGSVPMGEVTSFGFEKVANLTEVKERLTETVIWPMTDPERFGRLGIDPPKGILLHGPPGTGKTFVIKALAHESGAAFFAVKGAELLDKFVGESERGVRDVFHRARSAAPAIIFFDEFDALAPVRGKSTSTVSDSVVAALLTEIDGVSDRGQVSVIAATNRKDLIDPALLRSGRFETHLLLDLPVAESRLALLKITDVPLADDVDLEQLAADTDGLSFADLTGLLREAALVALRSDDAAAAVSRSHLDIALDRFRESRPQ